MKKIEIIKCMVCGLEMKGTDDWDYFGIETPNYDFDLCSDCSLNVEDKISEIIEEAKKNERRKRN